jgi:hypothetical protein
MKDESMARNYNIEGTKEYLMWALILLALAAWCVKDGWFPSEAVLLKHPLEATEHSNFYMFNKSLALLSGIASGVFFIFHWKKR